MNKEQAEAAARAIMEAETRKLAERQQRVGKQRVRAAGTMRLLRFGAGGYVIALVLASLFDLPRGELVVMGAVLGVVVGVWRGKARTDNNQAM